MFSDPTPNFHVILRQVPHRAWQHVAINGLFLVEIAHQEQIIYNNILSHPKRRLPRWLEHTSLSVCIHVGWTRIVWKKQFWERTARSIFCKKERYFQLLALSLEFIPISTSFVPTLSSIFYDYCFHIDFLIAHMIRHWVLLNIRFWFACKKINVKLDKPFHTWKGLTYAYQ